MKTIATLLFVLFSANLAIAQTGEKVASQDTLRNFSLKVVDKKGKPVSSIAVNFTANTATLLTDNMGIARLEGISDKDTMTVMLPVIGPTEIPLYGLDSVLITMKSGKKFKIKSHHPQDLTRTTPTNTISNVPELLKTRPARDLAELLTGLVPGLRITYGPNGITANIRGMSSINSSNEPLIVIDGMSYDSFSVVNNFLDVYTIQKIEVQKDGSLYGMRGANGVIVITTKGNTANTLN